MKGWSKEPLRHSLASRGVQTIANSKVKQIREMNEDKMPPEELYLDKSEYTEQNLDKIIKLFWWSSVNDNWKWFDFEKTFRRVINDFEETLPEFQGNILNLKTWQDTSRIRTDILENPTEEYLREEYGIYKAYDRPEVIEKFINSYKMYNKLNSMEFEDSSLQEKTILMDEVIDYLHGGGFDPFRNEAIERWRKEFEEEYL